MQPADGGLQSVTDVTGPGGHFYRVDTYIVLATPAGGTSVKQVALVVRKAGTTATLARVVSAAGVDF